MNSGPSKSFISVCNGGACKGMVCLIPLIQGELFLWHCFPDSLIATIPLVTPTAHVDILLLCRLL